MAAAGKITKIADYATQKLSVGQTAAIIVTVAIVVIGGFAGYAFYKDWNMNRDDDDDDDDEYGGDEKRSRINRLRRALVEKIRNLRPRGGTERTEPVPSSEPTADPALESDSDTESQSTAKLTGRVHERGREVEKEN